MKTRTVPFEQVVAGGAVVFSKLRAGRFSPPPWRKRCMTSPIRGRSRSWDSASNGTLRSVGAGRTGSSGPTGRYVTLVRLAQVEPIEVGPRFKPQSMRAWYVLDDAASPLLDVTLTDGALRNAYLVLPGRVGADARGAVHAGAARQAGGRDRAGRRPGAGAVARVGEVLRGLRHGGGRPCAAHSPGPAAVRGGVPSGSRGRMPPPEIITSRSDTGVAWFESDHCLDAV